ncbi:MAG TPA: DUF177 domain-containing protein [Elusimicrobiota bacterium]|nr:DUF177 domain-containing protein [Elusimicrobiota bacterium]
MLKLNVREIESAGHLEQTVSVPAEKHRIEMPDDFQMDGPLAVEWKADAFDDEVMVTGTAGTEVVTHCARCLADYRFHLQVRFEDHVPLTEPQVDLIEEIRQALLLALPMKPLCRGECAGLCPHCGKNLNTEKCGCKSGEIDPRFDKLKNLKLDR